MEPTWLPFEFTFRLRLLGIQDGWPAMLTHSAILRKSLARRNAVRKQGPSLVDVTRCTPCPLIQPSLWACTFPVHHDR
ncbi:hypothetical protein PISMIDRAFT_370733 [Pisolithus microcarpus 441]|uniref:Uncharacterized protein n=1 Tax=Pisolithus microcarpus 441 TaxID=765257 RepID=A0A0C9XNB7_9AGAM|nr:hypothetical protein PISMIDRAFT_370733 [Pisolithus microcarpus 441]